MKMFNSWKKPKNEFNFAQEGWEERILYWGHRFVPADRLVGSGVEEVVMSESQIPQILCA